MSRLMILLLVEVPRLRKNGIIINAPPIATIAPSVPASVDNNPIISTFFLVNTSSFELNGMPIVTSLRLPFLHKVARSHK